jgi:hypothetical protein
MTKTAINTQVALDKFKLLENMNMSNAWRGYGSAVFFEFGKLDQDQKGEYTLSATENWTLFFEEKNITSDDDWDMIDKKLKKLIFAKLENIALNGDKLSFKFNKFSLKINLDNMNNRGWSLNSTRFDEYLSSSDGSFVIEKRD